MRRVLIATVASAVAVLAGCAAPQQPEVTFYTDGQSAATTPRVRFDLAEGRAIRDEGALVQLKTRPGAPVQISVPAELSDGAWTVSFSYLDATGNRVDGGSKAFFPKDEQHAFTLTLPPGSRRLLLVSVQQIVFLNGIEPVVSAYWDMETVER
ncbi:DUF2771 domain-containing protein [Actinokineospora sp. PR83]|uniref:DUF2771 family protein n=1 Tax=Actinokineospora sp. PR83 TaxID=2884908 RepID=UPI0027E07193|nr:DUF2771 family protein [Actinokineospora sp. PR83]MCG8916768.1 DUF2771 domain-containing protein [Actinokineospora sp. PR83]